jgi:hypothetical protein
MEVIALPHLPYREAVWRIRRETSVCSWSRHYVEINGRPGLRLL